MRHCCEVFPKMIDRFSWFVFMGDHSRRCMPYIRRTDGEWRINFCPSCGSDVRAVEIDENDERVDPSTQPPKGEA